MKKGFSKLLFPLIIMGLVFIASCADDAKPTESVDPPQDTTDTPPDTTISSFNPTRLAGSPYPVSVKPDTLYVVYSDAFTDEQLLTIGSLQGILAQKKPRIYVLDGTGDSNYKIWLEDLAANYQTVVNYDLAYDFQKLIDRFKSEVNGYILTTMTETYMHTAISLSGIKQALVVTAGTEQYAKNAGLTELIANTSKMSFAYFIGKYNSEVNKNIMCYQTVEGSGFRFLTDYAVFGKMFHMYESSIGTNFTDVCRYLTTNAALFGWLKDKEQELVKEASKQNVFVHAADFAKNLSALSNYGVTSQQKGHYTNPETKQNMHTVCFLMSDGDNFQYLLGDFYRSRYNTTARGKRDIGWTMSPAMCEVAPTALKFYYDKASGTEGKRDYFVAAPSGLGYMNPDYYGDNSSYAALTAEYMKKSDMRILNIIGNQFDEQYLAPYLLQDQIDGLLYYDYADYAKEAGAIKFSNGKPIVTARYNLWPFADGTTTPLYESSTSLAAKLNNASTDITSADGYTLVAVHIWTQTVTDIMNCAVKLNSEKVRVVAPDEFIALIKKNVTH